MNKNIRNSNKTQQELFAKLTIEISFTPGTETENQIALFQNQTKFDQLIRFSILTIIRQFICEHELIIELLLVLFVFFFKFFAKSFLNFFNAENQSLHFIMVERDVEEKLYEYSGELKISIIKKIKCLKFKHDKTKRKIPKNMLTLYLQLVIHGTKASKLSIKKVNSTNINEFLSYTRLSSHNKWKSEENWFEKVTTCWSKHCEWAWCDLTRIWHLIFENSFVRSGIEIRVQSGIMVFNSHSLRRYFYREKYVTYFTLPLSA